MWKIVRRPAHTHPDTPQAGCGVSGFGKVAALGPDAIGVKVGDQRVIYPWIGCGKCARCRAGDENLCDNQSSLGLAVDGGFATHVVVPDSRYLFDLGDLDPALASTFACSGITALGAIKKFGRMDPESAALIIGPEVSGMPRSQCW